jgi:hypothetical protein
VHQELNINRGYLRWCYVWWRTSRETSHLTTGKLFCFWSRMKMQERNQRIDSQLYKFIEANFRFLEKNTCDCMYGKLMSIFWRLRNILLQIDTAERGFFQQGLMQNWICEWINGLRLQHGSLSIPLPDLHKVLGLDFWRSQECIRRLYCCCSLNGWNCDNRNDLKAFYKTSARGKESKSTSLRYFKLYELEVNEEMKARRFPSGHT